MSREQAAANTRARISAVDPDLLSIIDSLKEVFGARLTHITLEDGYVAGKEPQGYSFVPAPPPDVSGRKAARDWLRDQEAAHLQAHAKQAGAGSGRRAARGARR